MSKLRYAALILVVLVAALLMWQRSSRSTVTPPPEPQQSVPTATSEPIRLAKRATSSPDRESPANNTNDELNVIATRLMRQWAEAAKPFNFDPVITGYYTQTNRRDGRITGVGITTRTHFIEVVRRSDGDMVASANSSYESQRTLPEYEQKWYQCTGSWTEQAAVAETRAILDRMGATQTLANIAKHTYEATPLQLATPEGKSVTVTPFIIVEFYNAKEKRIVSAEYRMGATGPAGLVRWWHWPVK